MRRSLSFRIVITACFVLFGTLPVVLLAGPLLLRLFDASRESTVRELRMVSRGAADRMAHELGLFLSRVDTLARTSDMAFAARSLTFLLRADSLIEDFHAANPMVSEVWYFNRLQEVVSVAPLASELLPPLPFVREVVQDYVRREEQHIAVGLEFFECKLRRGEAGLCYFHPVSGVFKGLEGVLAIQIPFSRLAGLAEGGLPRSTTLALRSRKHGLLYGRPPDGTESLTFTSDVPLSGGPAFQVEVSEPMHVRMAPVWDLMWTSIAFVGAVLVGIALIGLLLARISLRPVVALEGVVRDYSLGRYDVPMPKVAFSEFRMVMATVADLGRQIQEHLRKAAWDAARESEIRKAQAESELQALKNQLKPHFLFNALNNIVSVIDFDPALAKAMTTRLAELYRLILVQSKEAYVPLATELAIVEHFLNLQKIRFGDRLRFDITCGIDATAVKVPGLLLQTLVENALKHGIEPCREGGVVSVVIRENPGRVPLAYCAEVINTGAPFVERSGGTGLENTRRRLNLVDGSAHGLTIGTSEQGTVVRFHFSGETSDGPSSHSR